MRSCHTVICQLKYCCRSLSFTRYANKTQLNSDGAQVLRDKALVRLLAKHLSPPRRFFHEMNYLLIDFWHVFVLAFAFNHFNIRFWGTSSQ